MSSIVVLLKSKTSGDLAFCTILTKPRDMSDTLLVLAEDNDNSTTVPVVYERISVIIEE